MEYLVGLFLALAVSGSATLFGFDKDRAFYPTVMIVIASYYGLFAVMGGSVQVLLLESIAIAAFWGISVLGFKRNLWLVVGALAAHGIFDFFHGHIVTNPGVPSWWPMFCLTYDIIAAAYLAWLLKRRRSLD
ncbi:MAG TPA: hypothetical protein V6C57_04020 [Coleofasciculaceae cyanobacterium]